MENLLLLQDLCVGYDKSNVLNQLTLRVNAGECVAITGASGVGKSTLIQSILGQFNQELHYRSGSIVIKDHALLPNSTQALQHHVVMRHIGIIYQDSLSTLDPLFTVEQQIQQVIQAHHKITQCFSLEEICIKLDITDQMLKQYPHQLSGGQAQRVGIALALVYKPHIILADEPTSSLDEHLQRQIMSVLKTYVKEEDACLILVTHQHALAGRFCDTLFELKNGQLHDLTTHHCISTAAVLQKETALNLERETPLFELEKVTAHYHKKGQNKDDGIHSISVTIPKGKITAIIGPSGVGKTTLAKVLSGLQPYQEGSIIYDQGQETVSPTVEYFKQVQYIFQNSFSAFHPRQTIGKSLEEPLRFMRKIVSKAERDTILQQMFENFQMDLDWLGKYTYQLSGGQCQRCAIVRALLVNPNCLICDEITTALDSENQDLVMQFLKTINQKLGVTIIFISHDLELVSQYADHFYQLKDGKLV